MKLTIGVTGPSGAGKSVACQAAERLGFQVIDCDKVAHKVLQNNSECIAALTNAFGQEILEDKIINRKKLAERAFASSEATALLNRTVLPFIVTAIEREKTGDKVVLDAPTLIQSGMHTECDQVIGILSDMEIRRQRILARDDIAPQEAEKRLSAAPDDEFFMENCDYIVYNNKDTKSFVEIFENLLRNILERRK